MTAGLGKSTVGKSATTSNPETQVIGSWASKSMQRQVSDDSESWNTDHWQRDYAGLGKSRQVGGDRKFWNAGYWQLGSASRCKFRQVGDDGKSWNAGYWPLG